jgi:hypothetical protein
MDANVAEVEATPARPARETAVAAGTPALGRKQASLFQFGLTPPPSSLARMPLRNTLAHTYTQTLAFDHSITMA